MRRAFFALIVSLAVASLLPVGAAGADGGVYIGVGGGATFPNGASNTRRAVDDYPALDVDSSSDTGFAVNGAVGYAFTNGLRVEGEVGYRRSDLNKINVKSPGALIDLLPPSQRDNPQARQSLLGKQDNSGAFSTVTLMFNGYYDIDVGSSWKPYVGGGVGVAFLSAESKSPTTGRKLLDDNDTVFAYQVGGGIGYEITPATTLSLDYRYFGTQDPALKSEVSGRNFDSEYGGHHVGASIRFSLP